MMKFFWKMPPGLRPFYLKELSDHRSFLQHQKFAAAWRCLERAHIIAQPWAIEHTYVHWFMLKFGVHVKNWREIIGQLPRLLVGGVKSFVGKIPVGNTGGANVPPLRVMEIPADIRQIMKPYVDNK